MDSLAIQTVFDEALADRLPELKAFKGLKVKIIVEELPEPLDRHPKLGAGKGRMQYQDNWDAPIDDFKDYE